MKTRKPYTRTKEIVYPPNPMDEAIKRVAEKHGGAMPSGSLTMIGLAYGRSRERVRQRAKKLGFIPPHEWNKMLVLCTCINCHNDFKPNTDEREKYCSKECYQEYRDKKYTVTGICKECGKKFKYRKVSTRGKRQYCSKSCFGKFIAREYGFQKGMIYRPISKINPQAIYEIVGKDTFTVKDLMVAKNHSYNYSTLLLYEWKIKGFITLQRKGNRGNGVAIYKINL